VGKRTGKQRLAGTNKRKRAPVPAQRGKPSTEILRGLVGSPASQVRKLNFPVNSVYEKPSKRFLPGGES
jgi:hypothetical protein